MNGKSAARRATMCRMASAALRGFYGAQEVLAKALFSSHAARSFFPFLQDLAAGSTSQGGSGRRAGGRGKNLLRTGLAGNGAYGGRGEADAAAERAGERRGLAHVSDEKQALEVRI